MGTTLTIKAVAGILSSIFVFLGLSSYIKDIVLKRIHPHILSWAGWGFVTGLGSIAMLSEGFTWGAVVVGANFVLCSTIAIFAISNGVGVWKVSPYDYSLFILGLIGLILWQTSGNPDLAIIFAILADFSFGAPTLIKICKHPQSENVLSWIMIVLAGLFGLIAVSYVSLTEIIYPVYLAMYDSSALTLILYKKKIFRKILKI